MSLAEVGADSVMSLTDVGEEAMGQSRVSSARAGAAIFTNANEERCFLAY